MALDIRDQIQFLKGVGPRKSLLLNGLGIKTIEDLLFHFPRYHEDRRHFTPISQLEEGQIYTLKVRILQVMERRVRRGLHLLKVNVADDWGRMSVTFFNQSFLKKALVEGREMIVTGKVEKKYGWQMNSPAYEFLEQGDDHCLNTGAIVPVYGLTEGLQQRYMRRIMRFVLDSYGSHLSEILPQDIRRRHQLMDRREAFEQFHFPKTPEHMEQARKRLIFDEFFVLQLALLTRKKVRLLEQKPAMTVSPESVLSSQFWQTLPFNLTNAQRRVMSEIEQDLCSTHVMNRLVQGDVGSGKTIVAVYAMLVAIDNGYQVALMAPTEILAAQHFQVMMNYLNVLQVNAALLVGSTKKKDKEQKLAEIKSGDCQLVVGTHALIQKNVHFHHLGLVIVDEQHKFGVGQRLELKSKGRTPDTLIMTATPIPRTLSMSIYGDLDVSVIDELPQGRSPIKTYWISEAKRQDMYGFIRKEIDSGRQVYFVCPLVEQSEKSDLKAAEDKYSQLKEEVFPDYTVGLVHGRMSAQDKEQVMKEFKEGRIHVLVATTVIEVGIDVPNASVMVIEDAVRFGLAQLHQLRGRVGRGLYASYCILIGQAKTDEAKKRMEVMVQTCDGFEIAEADLSIRGPGEFLGFRQHGVPELRIGSLVSDYRLMAKARAEAEKFLSETRLEEGVRGQLRGLVQERFGDKIELAMVG